MKLVLFVLLLTTIVQAGSLRIAAAANLSSVIIPLQKAFSKHHPEIPLRVVLGGSGKLTAQIQHHAPFDLFLSADMSYPTYLANHNMTLTQPQVYTKGSLAVLILKKKNTHKPLNELLLLPSINHIAMANPKTAPYGKATRQLLQNLHLFTTLKPKIIYGESIAQTLNYTLRGSDIGFVAHSALYNKKIAPLLTNFDTIIPSKDLYKPIKQGVVILQATNHLKEAQLFYNFLFSDEAQKIFQSYGYTKP